MLINLSRFCCFSRLDFPGMADAELVPMISDEEHAARRNSLQASLALAWKREGALRNLHSAFFGESVSLESAVRFFGEGAFGTGRKYARP